MESKKWLKDHFRTQKPIIAMCHFDPLPGDPNYDMKKGLDWVIERAHFNLQALQEGGVDAVMFSNEFSLPYLTKIEPITTMAMARIITELKPEIKIPYGVNVLWDPQATVELAVATGASFGREIFSGVYASDFGLWNTNYGEVARRRSVIGAQDVKLIFNILPEAATYLANRDIKSIARTTVFNCQPDILCLSGRTAGAETSLDMLKIAVEAVPYVPVFANTGVNIGNVNDQLSVVDGAVVGTTFKKNGDFFELVDQNKVSAFMEAVNKLR